MGETWGAVHPEAKFFSSGESTIPDQLCISKSQWRNRHSIGTLIPKGKNQKGMLGPRLVLNSARQMNFMKSWGSGIILFGLMLCPPHPQDRQYCAHRLGRVSCPFSSMGCCTHGSLGRLCPWSTGPLNHRVGPTLLNQRGVSLALWGPWWTWQIWWSVNHLGYHSSFFLRSSTCLQSSFVLSYWSCFLSHSLHYFHLFLPSVEMAD